MRLSLPRPSWSQAAWQLLAQTVSGLTYEQFTNIHDRVREQFAADLAGSAACHNRALFFKHIADQVAPKTGLAGDLYDRYWERFLEQAHPGPKESREVVAELARRVRAGAARAIFLEPSTNPRIVRQLARETGVPIGGVLYSDTLSGPDGVAPTYLAMLRHNIESLARALGGVR